MHRLSLFLTTTLLAMALAGCAGGPGAPSLGTAATPDKTGASIQAGYPTLALKDGPQGEADLKANPSVAYGSVIAKTSATFDSARFEALGAQVGGSFELGGSRYWHLSKNDSVVKLIRTLNATSGVYWAEAELVSFLPPNLTAQAGADPTRALGAYSDFNDPAAQSSDYSLEITKALDSYKTNGYGNSTVFVGVIDTGINMAHWDFYDGPNGTGNSIVQYAKSAFTKNNDGTFNWVGDGQNLVTVPAGENWDDEGHGTHVAGTIAARGNNGVANLGVAWKNTKIISYKCFSGTADAGSGSDWSIYGSLKDLTDWWKVTSNHPGQTTIPVNMSLGGNYAGGFELEMINYALANNVLPIVAMGNEGQRGGHFPAAYSGVVAVGATDGRDGKVPFSSTGSWISVGAPGYNLVSTSNGATNDESIAGLGGDWNNPANLIRQTGYVSMSGTSMATPFVTGVVGYLLSFAPTLTPDQIKATLESTADDKGTTGFDESFGYGRVNVLAAATAAKQGVAASGTTYVNKRIVATVRNLNANYDSGVAGKQSAVFGQAVYLYDADGHFVSVGLTNPTDGTAEFRLLKAGTYSLKTNYFGNDQTQSVTLDNVADQTVVFDFSLPIVFVQTVPNTFWDDGRDTGADTMITVYADDGTTTLVGPYDKTALDSLTTSSLESGKTYYVKVEPYVNAGTSYVGEYALNIGFSRVTSASVNPGRAENTTGQNTNTDAAHAKTVVLGTSYGEYLQAGGGWFKFVMP